MLKKLFLSNISGPGDDGEQGVAPQDGHHPGGEREAEVHPLLNAATGLNAIKLFSSSPKFWINYHE